MRRLSCTKHLSIGYNYHAKDIQSQHLVKSCSRFRFIQPKLTTDNQSILENLQNFMKFPCKDFFLQILSHFKKLHRFQTSLAVGICSQGASSAKTRSLKPPSSESEAPVQVKSRPRSSHLAKETQTLHFGKFMGKKPWNKCSK